MWRNVAEGGEDKATEMHAGVGEDEVGEVYNLVVEQNQVNVDGTAAVQVFLTVGGVGSLSTELLLYFEALDQTYVWF